MMDYVEFIFPIVQQCRQLQKYEIFNELLGSLTISIFVLPQSMAYSILAGLPPIYGLYTSTIPVIIYSIFSSSRITVTGTCALNSAILKSAVDFVLEIQELNINEDDRLQVTLLISSIGAIFQILMGLTVGNLIAKHLLPDYVISGVSAGAGFHILTSQFSSIFGFKIPRFENFSFFRSIVFIIGNIRKVFFPGVVLFLITVLVSIILKLLNPKIPRILVAVLFASFIAYIYNISSTAPSLGPIPLIGYIPPGLPSIYGLPVFNRGNFMLLVAYSIFPAIKVSFVSSLLTTAISLLYAEKLKDLPKISVNRDTIALGVSSLVGTLLIGSFLSCGSLSRTALAFQLNIKSQVVNVISALLVLISLLFLTEIFSLIPKPSLAAIISMAVVSLISKISDGVSYLKVSLFKGSSSENYFKITTLEGFIWWICFLFVFAFDIDVGLGIGMSICLLNVLSKACVPRLVEIFSFDEEANEEIATARERKRIDTAAATSSSSLSTPSSKLMEDIKLYLYFSPIPIMSFQILKFLIRSHMNSWKASGILVVIINVTGMKNAALKLLPSLSRKINDPAIFFVCHDIPEISQSEISSLETEGEQFLQEQSKIFNSFSEAIIASKNYCTINIDNFIE